MLNTIGQQKPERSRNEGAFDFAALRRREFARLDAQGHCYLDYTGSALYGVSQLREHQRLLSTGLFGNPHSDSSVARASTRVIEEARQAVLNFLGVDDRTHVVCFTANCSAAIKLVAESYPFGPERQLVLSADNHNSVNGIREYAARAGSSLGVLPLTESLELDDPAAVLGEVATRGGGLLAYPAQSNFSGVLHPLSLVQQARERGFDVLLDIAAYAPSHRISLAECPADFAVLSFYKLFGYPTGIGALVLRREAMRKLSRPWFAGGTVRYASVHANRYRLHDGAEGFEDGTPDFLGIAALPAGFSLLGEVSMDRLTVRVKDLAADLSWRLTSLSHANGRRVIRVYGPEDPARRGGAVTFNVLDATGHVVPYEQVESSAREAGISVRGGCFCNPGAAEKAFAVDLAHWGACLDTLDAHFTSRQFAACTGTHIGALRASVGLATDFADVARLADFLRQYAER
ncbi:aminotransferase class V-fold PLP-dependent enzyme [Tahibacter amnicola]|uniref:Aminotransferase class V-fold PLP-dependent enzyme n=1 Tax=Tahibacter amnicola TaxID=2976241 RepID=A0ABY6BLC8_9GAMM|nr:aminotransferase class V-fold PLP-dependent enzyme [Tahibacter amnicola]UXI70592.1 aminotransferase class V-fold PLP-dependent enzyme [Tahibacter amnicola]